MATVVRNGFPILRIFARNSCVFLRETYQRGAGDARSGHPMLCRTCTSASPWQLVSAVYVERLPTLTQEDNLLERAYAEMLQKIEFENSLVSDHELRHREDLKRVEKMKEGNIEVSDLDAAAKQTAQDFEDMSSEELKRFSFASRKTDDNMKSIRRRLDQSLILVIKQKLGNTYPWILPQTPWQEGETMRQTAERALKELSLDALNVQFMGNAPVGYYRYKYPKAMRETGKTGAKVFFFKSYVIGGDVPSEALKTDCISDYGWFTRHELTGVLQEGYCKAVEGFLIDDDDVYQSYVEWSRRQRGVLSRFVASQQ